MKWKASLHTLSINPTQRHTLPYPTNAAEMLIPRGENKPSLKCNITVLYNIAMADTIYYEDAKNRLLEKAKEEIVRLLSDLNNYEVKSYSDVFLMDNPQLQIGQSVTYKDGHGYELATRVLKLSTNIDYDFIQSITIGNQAIKGVITQLKEDVQTIIASGGSKGAVEKIADADNRQEQIAETLENMQKQVDAERLVQV